MARAKITLLALLVLGACGLKLDDTPGIHHTSPCGNATETFPSSESWSSELLSALLQCSQKNQNPLRNARNSLIETARWLNESFDSQSRQELVRFLDAVPPELGRTLQVFADSSSVADQKYWPEWIRWTQIVVSSPTLRPELLTEQLLILTKVPKDSLTALIALLQKLRAAPPATRIDVLERLTKIYVDFSRDADLRSFLNRGVTPLSCLKLEAGRSDTSLISSGWTLLLQSQNHPIKFGKTFAQSYGLLQNFCDESQIPSPTETYAALEYFIQNHKNVFLPILQVTDQSSRALIPLLRLWSQSKVHFDKNEFVSLLDALHRILTISQTAEPQALSSYVRVLAEWARAQSPSDVRSNIDHFKKIPWESFVVPTKVLNEWSANAEKTHQPFLQILAKYIEKDSHRKMAKLLGVIKVRAPSENPTHQSPMAAPHLESIVNRLLVFGDRATAVPLPTNAKFLKCLKSPSSFELWSCLKQAHEPVPFFVDFMNQEKPSPLFFKMSNPEQPGRWLGQGFFSPAALPRWTQALKKLRGLNLPVQHFVVSFPLATMDDDEKINQTYRWLQNTPQTQPETITLRNELGIPRRLSQSDFQSSTWLKWFDDPSKWASVQKVLTDPIRSPAIIAGLKKLTRRRIRTKLYRSDEPGLSLTSNSEIGMLTALDILLWEVPYDWTRKIIIGKILRATSAGDLNRVLHDSQALLSEGLWLLNSNPITRHGKLWKKATNALAILNVTISMRIENELFNWCEVMKALSDGLSPDKAEDFLVTLQKTGIISSISHLLHQRDPTALRFASSLVEVFHVIRNSKAKSFAWYNAVFENQSSHGLFVYQMLAMAEDALSLPTKFYHLKQMNALVRTGAQWVESEHRILPLKDVLDTVTGPETVLNPWIWIFLREIQDTRSTYHEPWMRLLGSLQNPAARVDVENWIESGIPADIGSWMDAIILTPSLRF